MKWTASFAPTATDRRRGVGVADVLGGEPDQPPRDVQRILAGLDHPREPVDAGVRIAVAQRLVERRDQVVVLLARLVVEQRPLLDGARQQRPVDAAGSGGRGIAVRVAVRGAASGAARGGRRRLGPAGERGGQLQEIERHPGVAVGVPRNRGEGVVVRRELRVAEAAFPVVQRAPQDVDRLVRRERPQDEHLRARQQRGVHLEGRVLGRRADQRDVAGFDARQERILLRLVEAVDLVDEQDGAARRHAARGLGLGHHGLDVPDAGEHRAERDEVRARRRGDEPGHRRLAGARRAPQDDRLQRVALDGGAQRLAGRQQLLLAHELVERPRAHPLGQRCRRRTMRLVRRLEQASGLVRHDASSALSGSTCAPR